MLTNECLPAIIELQNKCLTFRRGGITMSIVEIIKTFFEFAAVVLLIIGFVNEEKVVDFEVKFARAVKIHLCNRRLRKQREAARQKAAIQKRAPSEDCFEQPVLTLMSQRKSTDRVA